MAPHPHYGLTDAAASASLPVRAPVLPGHLPARQVHHAARCQQRPSRNGVPLRKPP
jgi:hypothetical protein